ncbi:MAG TPA: glycine cleavage system aminomethyltransferase GcvT [Pirellulales bacterium]|nr:glycine cleavage system aminomethyltransferase GcvT [Pirellulales bacterium]
MSNTELRRTPLYDWHANHGGRMVDFAGWSMPVQYSSIVAEHQATRTAVGLFDVSHMGRLRFDGPEAGDFLDRVTTRSVRDLKPGQVRYSLITNESGGILDDVLVYLLADAAGQPYFLMVVNASNREKILDWLRPRISAPAGVQLSDVTCDWAMIAVQGPGALAAAQPLVEVKLSRLKYYRACESLVAGHGGIVSRTGYTGEDGCELIVGSAVARGVWEALAAAGGTAAGLGARDTLRLEAAMPLYGHELSEDVNPFQAGLAFAVDLEGRTFPGRDVLARAKDDPRSPRRVGLAMEGKRPAREGNEIRSGGRVVGRVTSGTLSPTLGRPIAMGYVEPQFALSGQRFEVDVRGQMLEGSVVELPFYKRPQPTAKGV